MTARKIQHIVEKEIKPNVEEKQKTAKVRTNVPMGILAATKKVTQPLQDIANSLAAIAKGQAENTAALAALTKAMQNSAGA